MARTAKIQRKTNETADRADPRHRRHGRAPDRDAGAVLQPHARGGREPRPLRSGGRRRPATSRSTPTTPSRTSASAWARRSARRSATRAASRRYGEATIPMDETLVSAAVDFGGRAAFVYRADALKGRRVGTFDVELGREFFGGFVSTALCNLHLEVRYGENAHHMIEALFKAFARATSAAARRDPRVRRRAVDQGNAHVVSATRPSSSPIWEAATCAASRRRWPRSARASSISADADAVARADKLVVPGQGAFGACAAGLDRGGGAHAPGGAGRDPRRAAVLRDLHRHAAAVREQRGEPGRAAGLGILPGRVRRFADRPGLKIPHMGWNADPARPGGGGRARGRRRRRRLLLLRAQLLPRPGARRGRGAVEPARRRLLRRGRPRQRVRLPVPPREEPGGWARASLRSFVARAWNCR